jgi:ATP-binding cassette subfamily B protein
MPRQEEESSRPDTLLLVRRCLLQLRPYLSKCVPILASVLLEMAFYSGLPFSFRYIVDFGLLAHNRELLFRLITALAAGGILVAIASFLRDRLYARLTASLLTDLRITMFDHLQRLSMDFFGTQRTGDILARFSTDLAVVESAASGAIAWAVLPGLDVLAGTVLLFVLDWKLALIALLIFPLTITGPRIFAPRVAEESYRRKGEESKVLSFLQENLSAQIVVKTFGLADYSRRNFLGHVHGLRERMVRVGIFSALVERSAYVGIMLLQVGILATGAYMVSAGELTVGALASFQALFLSLSYSMATLTQYVPTLVEAFGGVRRVEELLRRQPRVRDTGAKPVPRFSREIRFEHVGFGYAPERQNLQSVNVAIPQGEYVAVVGASGSGKSTILNLLMRLYDPDEGAITIDSVDLRQVPLIGLRRQFGYVPQESFLFDVSIRENIRLGDPSASQEQVEAAARAAEVHDFILELPQGYDTPAGERGNRLSGGQKQRIALARAIVRNPAILILDEATSALDAGTEAAILDTLERLRAGRTILSVTHRLHSVITADRILVLEQGTLREQGTHLDLVAGNGPYRRMWERQHGFKLDQKHHHAEISLARLRLVPVFYGMSDELLAEAVKLFRTEEYPAGRVVYRRGDYGEALYVIVRGSVELRTETGLGELQRGIVLQEGDCFGEAALFESEPQGENVETLVPCVFLSINRGNYLDLRERMG